MPEAFTLRVFVPSGDPEGAKIIDRMNWTGRGSFVPREDWPTFRLRPENETAGVYVLVGHEEDQLGNEYPVIYIGQAENVRLRIDQHDEKKEFWDRVAFFVSANNGLNRAHITWLEWALMDHALRAKRCRLENALTHSEPALSESEKADTRSFLGEMLRMMPVVGLHVFEQQPIELARPASAPIAAQPFAGAVKDVLIVPAQPEGFESAFLNSNAWWAIRVAAKHRPNLRWIAAYQVLPIAAVTHVAEIASFEPYGDEGKFKVVFKGPAQALEKPIPFGNAIPGSMQGPRYCSKQAFDTAATVADLK
jgi:hypothetical protein